jgi:hypothetical protein
MSDLIVPEMTTDNAVLLLAAAESLGLPPEVVRTSSDGFIVSEEVHTKAFGKAATKKADSVDAEPTQE